MMSSMILILQWIGWILLLLFVTVLLLLLLVLFVPIRYEGQLDVADPAPHEEAAWGALRGKASASAACRWLGPLLHISITLQGEIAADIRIAWLHIDPMSLAARRGSKEPHAAREDEQAPQIGIYDKIVGVYRKADYYRRVLGKEETAHTIERLRTVLLRTMRRLLPQRWRVAGTIGLGDPAATARVLEVQGMLYPILAGHIDIAPEFEQYQMDIHGALHGRIRLVHLITALVSIVTDSRIRLTIRRCRNADRAIAAHYDKAAS